MTQDIQTEEETEILDIFHQDQEKDNGISPIENEPKKELKFKSYEGRSKSPLYTFIFLEDVPKDAKKSYKPQFKCIHCNKVWSMSNGLTNFQQYLKRKHPFDKIDIPC